MYREHYSFPGKTTLSSSYLASASLSPIPFFFLKSDPISPPSAHIWYQRLDPAPDLDSHPHYTRLQKSFGAMDPNSKLLLD